jgi:hypothetical protein
MRHAVAQHWRLARNNPWCQELAAVLARLQESHRQYPDEGAKLAEHVEKVFIGLTGSSTP